MQNQELTYKYDQLRTNDLGSIEFDFDFGDLMGPSEKPDFEEIRTFLKNEFNEELVRSFLSMELESTKKKELSLDETLEIVKRLDSVGVKDCLNSKNIRFILGFWTYQLTGIHFI